MLAAVVAVHAPAAVPGWWSAFTRMTALESRFRQESESLVFGKLTREGHLVLARGGRLRVAYDGGLQVSCDGRHLVQYDPDTRTAQQVPLTLAVRDFPLLGVLLDPTHLARLYRVEPSSGDSLRLVPREAGLPGLQVSGRSGQLRRLEWTDPTGARQTLELLDPRTPSALSPGAFRPQVPSGTRWATPNG